MAAKRYQLDPETLRLLQLIESTDREETRRAAILDLSRRGGMDAARILIETFERSMWRSTKFLILQALGFVNHERATEFLCQVAMDTEDFAMAAEAVMALGTTDDPVAGEFLASIIRKPNHPLARESLTALANLNFFPCEAELSGILTKTPTDTPPSLLQNAVIGAGLRGYRRLRAVVESYLRVESSGPLFNSALMALGRIGDVSSLALLERLDTRYRAFAHQLKVAAMDHLRLRLGYTIEDAVAGALSADVSVAKRQAWQILAAFPEDAAREALHLLAADASLEFKAMERICYFSAASAQDDFAFLAEHGDAIPRSVFAALARLHTAQLPREKLLSALDASSQTFKVKFLGLVRVEKGWDILLDLIGNPRESIPLRLSAINAVTVQPLMNGGDADVREQIGKSLVRLAETETDEVLAGRLIRAIGQLKHLGPDASNLLRDRIKSGGQGVEGVYAALARCDSEDSSRMIAKRLRQIVSNPENQNEVRSAILSLARCSRAADVSCLANVSTRLQDELQGAILKILCSAPVPEMVPFVSRALDEKDFQTRLLAVVAAKHHHNDDVWEKVFRFSRHENPSLSGRAVDTIATAGGAREHLKLLAELQSRALDADLFKKVFRSLTPRQGDDYREVIAAIEGLLHSKPGVMADLEIFQSAVNLRDNLAVLGASAPGKSAVKMKGELSVKDRHAIDETLGRSLRGFSRYSETIKSVLRSGEVTWQHPELFDARVDKSTVLVQYVKSIDLLLQEKIGSQMFLGQGADFLQKMQSRVVRLELDDDSGFDTALVTGLDCSMYFSRDTFPAHKLSLICRSIMTGLIMKEQYRVVDGLRAWALLLLLFGREFKFRGKPLEPLFPMAKFSNDGIGRIARAMNDLQDARNRAAHRGTMLEMANMQEMRELCSSLLNDLDSHLIAG